MDYETFRKKFNEGQKNLEAYQGKYNSGGYRTIPSSSNDLPSIPGVGGKYDLMRQVLSTSNPVPPPVSTSDVSSNTDVKPWGSIASSPMVQLHADAQIKQQERTASEDARRNHIGHEEEVYQQEKADDFKKTYDAWPKWKQIGYDVANSSINKGFDNFMRGALDTASFGATRKLDEVVDNVAMKMGDDPKTTEQMKQLREAGRDTTAYKVGEFGGYLIPGAVADRAIVEAGGAALRSLPKITQGLVRGSATGALDMTAQETGDVAFRDKTFDPLNVALGAGLGGALGAAVPLIGKGVSKFVDNMRKDGEALATRVDNSVPGYTDSVANKKAQAIMDDAMQPLPSQLDPSMLLLPRSVSRMPNATVTPAGTRRTSASLTGSLDDVSPSEISHLQVPALPTTPARVNPVSQAMHDTVLPTGTPRPATISPDALHVAQAEVISKQAKALDDSTLISNLESRIKNTRGAIGNNDIRLAEDHIKRLQTAGDLDRAVNLADTMVSQLTKSGQSIEAANIWHGLSPDAYIRALDRNLERVNNARFGADTSLHKPMPQVERDSALKVATLAQSIGEHLEEARNVHALLTFTGTRRPLDNIEQGEVRKFLQSMQESMDAGLFKNLKDPDVVAYRNLITKMDDGVDKAGQDFLRSTLPDIIRLSNHERKLALQDMQAIKNGQDMLEFRVGRKMSTIQYLHLLFNVPTQLRNVISNELMWYADRFAHMISVPFDMARSLKTGKREIFWKTGLDAGENFFSPLGRDYGNFAEGAKLGGRAGWNGVNPEGLTSKYEIGGLAFSGEGKFNIMGKTMNFLERTLGATMKGADHGAFNRAYMKRLEESSYAQAVEMAKRMRAGGTKVTNDYVNKMAYNIMQKANSNIDNIAKEHGLYMTLQDDTKISRGLVNARRWVNSLTGSKDFGIGSIVMPFAKIPANIAMRAFDYSPLGFARDFFNLNEITKAYRVAEKQFEHAKINDKLTLDDMFNMSHAESARSNAHYQLSMGFGRMIMGSAGLGGMGLWLASKGLIWGSESKDMNKRKYDESQGKQGFQVNISGVMRAAEAMFTSDTIGEVSHPQEGDTFVSYEYFLPVMFPVAIASNIYQSVHDKGAGKHVGAEIADNVGQTTDFIFQSSPLRGVRDVFNVNTYTDKTMAQQMGENMLQSLTGQVVPSMAKQIESTLDNKVYETYDPGFWANRGKQLQAAAPFSKDGLPQRVTTLGDPMEKDFNKLSMLNPFRSATYKESDTTKFLNDILDQTGNDTLVPKTAVKTLSIPTPSGPVSVKLSSAEWTKLQEMTGKELTRRLGMIHPNLPIDQREYAVKNVLSDVGTFARNTLLHDKRQQEPNFFKDLNLK